MGWRLFGDPPAPPPPPPRTPTYFYVFCALLVAHHIWELYLKLRTRLRLQREKGVPPAVKAALGTVDEEEYAKAQTYSMAKNNFGLVADHLLSLPKDLAELALQPFLWNGPALSLAIAAGFTAEDELVRMGAMMILSTPWDLLTSMPLSAYRNFVLEERFGFNKYTVRTWLSDKLTSV